MLAIGIIILLIGSITRGWVVLNYRRGPVDAPIIFTPVFSASVSIAAILLALIYYDRLWNSLLGRFNNFRCVLVFLLDLVSCFVGYWAVKDTLEFGASHFWQSTGNVID